MLIRYEEENTSLRQYMEGMTRQQQQHHGLKGKVDGPGTQVRKEKRDRGGGLLLSTMIFLTLV